ncbi:hypothetical protein AAFF_G00229150 [Aldrovandia affinis]|uniref:Phospholipid phosphatase-related protein type 3 n=1 Tax=Aldrovandia affinis TaxID=143900 RepID=A0AAD7WV75_9TELE|nr:hypothetical protein AAFF_G00229150 [Aldrovandia affinis]
MSAKERQKGKVTKDSVTLLPCFYFVELPILASSVVSLYFLELTDVFKPVRSGYSCNDRSLSMPYIEPTHEVVPFLMLFSLAFAGPAITIMIGEGILAVRFVGVHVFGLCATALITDIIQLSTGYHAPYFLTVCKPNYTTLNTSCDENTFIMEDICSGANPAVINAGRKSFPSQHATLASFAAVYVSMYFNATLTDSSKLLKPLLVFSFIICAIICGLTRIIQFKNHAIDVYCGFLIGGGIAVYLGLYAVGNFQPSEDTSREQRTLPREPIRDGLAPHANATLTRNPRDPGSMGGTLKRSSADVEILSPRSPMGKESMVTFSNTLPRVHTPAMEEVTRRNASIHASMDSTRSKQLLSQWKTKNESRKLSLQVMETEAGHSPQRSIEMRCSSEPVRVGINGEHQPPSGQYVKLATGSSGGPMLPNNSIGMPGGARVSIQSRPGSSQLVHIPEETQENVNTSPKSSSARSKWLKVAEKSGVCRANSQPRIMQVIAMSKQQGLLQGGSEGSAVSCTGSIRYKALTDQEPGGIVRVEAHPEHGRPVVQPPSTDGSGSWKWKPQERGSIRQSFELNDLNRDSESCESLKDGYGPVARPVERRRPCSGPDLGSDHYHHHHHHHHHHPHGITTIRVTPVEGSEAASETLSIASSRDSTLRRKGNIILLPERGPSPDSGRNVFYKGTSPSPAFKE